MNLNLFDAWYEWFYLRWCRGEGVWPGGSAIANYVELGEYNGFAGEF